MTCAWCTNRLSSEQNMFCSIACMKEFRYQHLIVHRRYWKEIDLYWKDWGERMDEALQQIGMERW